MDKHAVSLAACCLAVDRCLSTSREFSHALADTLDGSRNNILMPPTTIPGGGIVFSSMPSVSLLFVRYVNIYFSRYLRAWWRDFNETCHRFSSCECALLTGFQGQRSEVKVMTRMIAVVAEAFRPYGVDAHFLVWGARRTPGPGGLY